MTSSSLRRPTVRHLTVFCLLFAAAGIGRAQHDEIVALAINENGWVGIGTEHPQAALEVYSTFSERSTPNVLATQADDTARFIARRTNFLPYNAFLPPTDGDTIGIFGASGWAEDPDLVPPADKPPGFIEFRAAEAWAFEGFATEMSFWTTRRGARDPEPRMTITHDGKVGIGTIQPESALEVIGSLRLGVSATDDLATFEIWPALGDSGVSCSDACDPGFCLLGGYTLFGNQRVACGDDSPNRRVCMCVGRR